jgi:NAD(P)-dependent dehydrogenase (short-subunit alcohol dehydrogenase family)
MPNSKRNAAWPKVREISRSGHDRYRDFEKGTDMNVHFNFEGRVALVTGAGQGIGEAIAFHLAESGAIVYVNDVQEELIHRVTDKIRSKGHQAFPYKADVTSREDVFRMVDAIVRQSGSIDFLVNNAGISKPAQAEDMTEAQFSLVIDVNLKGPFLCSQAAAKYMLPKRYGRIVNMSSVAALGGYAGRANYCSSKAGLVNLTRVLALEWAKHNVRVNAVAPGITLTELAVRGYTKETQEKVRSQVPMDRLGRVSDIVPPILFLLSDAAEYITGQTICIDGGMTAVVMYL